jgi:hypothetical protein
MRNGMVPAEDVAELLRAFEDAIEPLWVMSDVADVAARLERGDAEGGMRDAFALIANLKDGVAEDAAREDARRMEAIGLAFKGAVSALKGRDHA